MTLQETAEYLRVEPIQVARLVKQGEIPFSGTTARPIFDKDEIDSWASRRILGMGERRLADYNRESSQNAHGADAPLDLCSITRETLVVLDLPSKTKASVLSDITRVAEEAGLLYDPRDLLESLREREALCSTGLAGGVAIVHPRHHDPYLASESFMAIVRTAVPIHFGAPDGKPTDIFFALVMQDDRLHLRALARLCLVLTRTNILESLRAAETPAEAIAALSAAEGGVG